MALAALPLFVGAAAASFYVGSSFNGAQSDPRPTERTAQSAIDSYLADPVSRRALQVDGVRLESVSLTQVGSDRASTVVASVAWGERGAERVLFGLLSSDSAGYRVEETSSICLEPARDPDFLVTVPFPATPNLVFRTELGQGSERLDVEGTSVGIVRHDGRFVTVDAPLEEARVEDTSQVYKAARGGCTVDERASCAGGKAKPAHENQDGHNHEHADDEHS